jgi:hypothetical protein
MFEGDHCDIVEVIDRYFLKDYLRRQISNARLMKQTKYFVENGAEWQQSRLPLPQASRP